MSEDLTPKQSRFVDEYLIDLNATQAYIRAGYAAKNGNTAMVCASQLLSNPKIRSVVDARNRVVVEAAAGSAQWVVDEAVRVVREGKRDRVPALALLAKRLPEFKDGMVINVDNRSIQIPPGTTYEDLVKLTEGLDE